MLRERDWIVADLSAGIATEDLLAKDPDGGDWSVEVKMTKAITVEHRKQAQEQAKQRRARWMLCSHIEGTSSWLVQRQGCLPTVWQERDVKDS